MNDFRRSGRKEKLFRDVFTRRRFFCFSVNRFNNELCMRKGARKVWKNYDASSPPLLACFLNQNSYDFKEKLINKFHSQSFVLNFK